MKCINEKFLADGYSKARKGIAIPKPIDLGIGQKIYRFYDSSKAPSPKVAANGAWWFEFGHFQTIKHFALRHGHSFGYAVRLFAAIPYESGEVNAFVRCELQQPLKALKGRGKQVESSGIKMTPMQSILEVNQLYLPGFGGPIQLRSLLLLFLVAKGFSQGT